MEEKDAEVMLARDTAGTVAEAPLCEETDFDGEGAEADEEEEDDGEEKGHECAEEVEER